MTAVTFETLKFARALRERAHLTAEQAEGLSEAYPEAVQGGLPTRADLQRLEGSVNAGCAAVRSEIAAFKSDITSEFASVRSEMKLIEQRMTIKLGAMLVALGGIPVTAIRSMPVR